jgi:hypothetical protein
MNRSPHPLGFTVAFAAICVGLGGFSALSATADEGDPTGDALIKLGYWSSPRIVDSGKVVYSL